MLELQTLIPDPTLAREAHVRCRGQAVPYRHEEQLKIGPLGPFSWQSRMATVSPSGIDRSRWVQVPAPFALTSTLVVLLSQRS
jgi:hypothetical protein